MKSSHSTSLLHTSARTLAGSEKRYMRKVALLVAVEKAWWKVLNAAVEGYAQHNLLCQSRS